MKSILGGKRFYWIAGFLVLANLLAAYRNLASIAVSQRPTARARQIATGTVHPGGARKPFSSAPAVKDDGSVRLSWKMGQIQSRLGPSRADNILIPVKFSYRLGLALDRLGTPDEQKLGGAIVAEVQPLLISELRRSKLVGTLPGLGLTQYTVDQQRLAGIRQKIANRFAAAFPPEKAEALLSWTLGAYGTTDSVADYHISVTSQTNSPMHLLTIQSNGETLYAAPLNPATPGDWTALVQ